eukprot:GILK01007506.1.p1 GENE.GILK01007506.1~~GILK01007506.1.p1  ORF type:complete len:695 (+),score=117.29 GILK01007506.1:48-2132(+)
MSKSAASSPLSSPSRKLNTPRQASTPRAEEPFFSPRKKETSFGFSIAPVYRVSNSDRPSVQQAAWHNDVTALTTSLKLLSREEASQLANDLDPKMRTALHYACFQGHFESVTTLIKYGADCRLKDINDRNPFHLAALRGHVHVVRFMLYYELQQLRKQVYASLTELKAQYRQAEQIDGKAYKQERDAHLQEGLESALRTFYRDVIQLQAAVLEQPDRHGRNPIHYAALSKFHGCNHCLAVLTRRFGDHFDEENETELLQVENQAEIGEATQSTLLQHRIVEEVSSLLDSGLNKQLVTLFRKRQKALMNDLINARDENGFTPLHLAAIGGDCKCVQILITEGADTTVRDNIEHLLPIDWAVNKMVRQTFTDLCKAAASGDDYCLKLLIDCGGDVNERLTIFCRAPLHAAVEHAHKTKDIKLLEYLLDSKADVNVIDSNGWTPLHFAAEWGESTCAEMLLSRNADVDARSNKRRSPLHLAAQENNVNVANLLVQNGAQLEAQDDEGLTPLMAAARKGKQQAVMCLLHAGAKPNAQDLRRWTPLHWATFNGHAGVVQLLCDWDADKKLLKKMVNAQGKTPFEIAKDQKTRDALDNLWEAAERGDLDGVRRMVRAGQDINRQTIFKRRTPLHLAMMNGHDLVVRYLRQQGADMNIRDKEGRRPEEYHPSVRRNSRTLQKSSSRSSLSESQRLADKLFS